MNPSIGGRRWEPPEVVWQSGAGNELNQSPCLRRVRQNIGSATEGRRELTLMRQKSSRAGVHRMNLTPDFLEDPEARDASLRARGMLRLLSADEQAAYLEGRASRARPGRMAEILAKAGTTDAVLPGDAVPEDWLPPTVTAVDDAGPGDDGPVPRLGA
jgi:hypothetical protein